MRKNTNIVWYRPTRVYVRYFDDTLDLAKPDDCDKNRLNFFHHSIVFTKKIFVDNN